MTIKEIAIELLKKYEASENVADRKTEQTERSE